MASGGKFIAGAIKRPGALTQKAKAAGMSVDAFARAHQHDTGVTGDEARFYLNVLRKTGPSRLAQAASKPSAPASSGSAPKFGSPAWDAKYGVKRFGRA